MASLPRPFGQKVPMRRLPSFAPVARPSRRPAKRTRSALVSTVSRTQNSVRCLRLFEQATAVTPLARGRLHGAPDCLSVRPMMTVCASPTRRELRQIIKNWHSGDRHTRSISMSAITGRAATYCRGDHCLLRCDYCTRRMAGGRHSPGFCSWVVYRLLWRVLGSAAIRVIFHR